MNETSTESTAGGLERDRPHRDRGRRTDRHAAWSPQGSAVGSLGSAVTFLISRSFQTVAATTVARDGPSVRTSWLRC